MRLTIVFTALILLFAGLEAQPLLSAAETGQLVEMLQAAELDSLDLNFEKDWDLSTKYKLDWQLRQLQNPWQALTDLQDLRELCALVDTIPEAVPRLLTHLAGIAFNLDPELQAGHYAFFKSNFDRQFRQRIRKPEDLFNWLETNLADLQKDFDLAVADFSRQDAEQLTAFWLWQFIESEDVDKYEAFYRKQGLPDYGGLDKEQVRERLGGIKLDQLLETGVRFVALADAVRDNASRLKFKNKRPLLRKTELGLMVIGTQGDDMYDPQALPNQPVCFLLEPGGDDVYGIDLKNSYGSNFYILADLKGDDLYRNANPAGMFCSAFGCGYSADLAGNDIYQADDFAFSAFMGLNLHQDFAGDDSYRSGLFSQGAAMFGVAALLDQAGNDTYSASATAQGLGGTHGVGALLDQSGADSYNIGGEYYHEPLMPLDFITLGQGMGLGLRPDLAGGLGLLYDRSGSDRYLGGVYAQGSGYWYATGALIDEAGNDVYNTVYYPQGSGIHLACGFLFDAEGDDAYYSRNGPGQGAGHDWALGMLIDGAGNDAYSIPGGNGLALTNSVALFVDKSGDDRYERKEVQNYGSANLVRSTGGIGLFLDAGGKDSYPDSLYANNKTWQSGTYGIGRDIELNVVAKSEIEELAETAAMPDSTASIADIFDAASEWEVGSAVQRVRRAREILLGRTEEAIPYVLENKMATDSGLEFRVLELLAKNSAAFVERLFPLIEGADSLAAKNAMSLISGVGDSLLVNYVERLMQARKYQTACLAVLAGVHTARSVELLQGYIFHPSERFRYIAARSLMQVKHPSARPTLLRMSSDRSFLVQALLRNLPPEQQP